MTHIESQTSSPRIGKAESAVHSSVATAPTRSPGEIQDWIVSYLARHLNSHPDEIEVDVPFEQFALDSASAIEMTGYLEDWLGHRVDPMTVFDYPTISEMAEYLGGGGCI